MSTGDGTNFIASAFGRKRSGKSYWLRTLARKFPRLIVLDFIGEFLREGKRIPGAYECRTLEETALSLVAARQKGPQWTIVTMIDPSEVAILLDGIMGGDDGFANVVGGIALECGEVDLIAPNHAGISKPVFNVFARGRHYGISALVGTQRPRATHRIVTSQSDVIAAFRQHEDLDVEFFAELIAPEAADIIRGLDKYAHIRYYESTGAYEVIDADGKVLQTSTA